RGSVGAVVPRNAAPEIGGEHATLGLHRPYWITPLPVVKHRGNKAPGHQSIDLPYGIEREASQSAPGSKGRTIALHRPGNVVIHAADRFRQLTAWIAGYNRQALPVEYDVFACSLKGIADP